MRLTIAYLKEEAGFPLLWREEIKERGINLQVARLD